MHQSIAIGTEGTASVDPVVFTLRYHPHGAYGSPFTFVCTLVRHGREATITGASGEMTPRVWRTLVGALRELDIDAVNYERKGRLARMVTVDIAPRDCPKQ